MTVETHRLAALCFADIAGYTELSAVDESEAIALVRLFQDVARRAVEEHGGRVVKFIGDAVLAEFTSTSAATRAALDLRDRFVAEARARSMGTRSVRVGVHVGEIVTSPDGDLYGDGVNVASRIHAAAPPVRCGSAKTCGGSCASAVSSGSTHAAIIFSKASPRRSRSSRWGWRARRRPPETSRHRTLRFILQSARSRSSRSQT